MPLRRSQRKKKGSTTRIEVTISDDESDVEIIPSPPKICKPSTKVISSGSNERVQEKSGNGSHSEKETHECSDSSDDSDEPKVWVQRNYCEPVEDITFSESESDVVDVFSLDFRAQKRTILEDVKKRMQENEQNKMKDTNIEKVAVDNETTSPLCCSDEGISRIDPLPSVDYSPASIDVSNVLLKSGAKLRTSRKTRKALAKLRAFSSIETDDGLNDSVIDEVLFVDSDVGQSTFKIRWGTDYLRLNMIKNGKFIHLYQQLADMNDVSISQVVLSFNDKLVPPESRPSHIEFTVADILDGGIIKKSGSDKEESVVDEYTIPLKIQTADRKGTVTLNVHKCDKFSIIMKQYAKSNTMKSNFKLFFDGEKIDESLTPMDYDLEGDECIDLYDS